jgi:protein TonB
MRSASFFFLSVILHAAVLAYPVTFARPTSGEAIRVIILPMESESVGGGDNGGSGGSTQRSKGNSHSQRPLAASPRVEAKPAAEPQIVADAKVENVSESRVALASELTAPSDSADTTSSIASAAAKSVGDGTSGTWTGGNGSGANGAGPGNGSGNGAGSGSGSSASGIVLTQARYRETPRPDYPENARREGREGRVLLRVLVDAQGRSKRVEINASSGSDALDRAAAEAIKSWRFHPARQGEQPVESWLRVPIEFHLQDVQR